MVLEIYHLGHPTQLKMPFLIILYFFQTLKKTTTELLIFPWQEELLAVLTMMVGANISPEQLLSIAERTILEADEDKDDLISFEEFAKVLERTDVEQKMSIRFLN